ncbi:DUF1631 family protein [Marinobacter confluentis]|uniref:DUF1631 family protein n=1 Tax=Marinobacter confluentis TaxID=1697557 RepID=A0A4Z1CJC7_9GAMM|nr:DUF1631 family protein [Marinobacter confluentis]TGN41602.1 DUF1631 family protein [Marinobacter confluentis]
MQQGRQLLSLEQAKKRIGDVLSGIRVPDLPYPVGKPEKESVSDWTPLLMSCWTEQRDEPVSHVIRSVSLTWSVRQINAAYVSDRIMDVFLKSSGLHPELAGRLARLRFFLAWRMNLEGGGLFNDALMNWLDSFQDHRGWSANSGRSSRLLLDQLDALTIEVAGCFESGDTTAVMAFCQQWIADAEKREQQTERLRERLLKTEQGAARQRRAEHTARALIGRAMKGRQLPEPIVQFVMETWFPLLKQIIWEEGLDGDNWRHASKLLEWLVWIGDPKLSDKDKNRLYTVGEQIGDRINDVWSRLNKKPLPEASLAGIQSVMVQRLRGEVPELVPALPPADRFSWDSSWLALEPVPESDYREMAQKWYVEGEGAKEQRRFFLTLLEDTQEVLWTNGAGVRLGFSPWSVFRSDFDQGVLRPLAPIRPFGEVLAETVTALSNVLQRQMQQRKQAAEDAQKKAAALRKEKEQAEKVRAAQQAAEAAEKERLRLEAEAQRQADQDAEAARLRQEKEVAARILVEGIKLGGWIVVENRDSPGEPRRLKLAVRINASRKLVFVDRLGLNRREYIEDALIEDVVEGNVRVLGVSAEFDDTLSRVVGRIRVGKQ